MAAIGADRLTPEEVWQALREDWLIGPEDSCRLGVSPNSLGEKWADQVRDRRRQLHHLAQPFQTPKIYRAAQTSPIQTCDRPLVLIAEPKPQTFLASFLAAALAGWDMALANPQWGDREWSSLNQLIAPDLIWGQDISQDISRAPAAQPNTAQPDTVSPIITTAEPAILIPTGGSSGQIKLAHHTWSSLMTSVAGFRSHFAPDGSPINTYCVLPVHHVSGLMQALRAWTNDAQVILTSLRTLENGPPLSIFSRLSDETPNRQERTDAWFISLVPTQLQRLLQSGKGPWLSQFQAVLLGGAPPWPTLLTQATDQHIPLCLSYGMTETAAMVTAAPVSTASTTSEEGQNIHLLAHRSSGQALPHATLKVVTPTQPPILQHAQSLPAGEIGQIVVHSHAIAHGYYGQSSPQFGPNIFCTDDLGYLSADGQLHITGRASSKIISGGENIFPAEVEATLRSTGQVKDVCVVGLPHEQWGEVVTAIYVPAHPQVSSETLQNALRMPSAQWSAQQPSGLRNRPALSRYKIPKRWIPVPSLPRNDQGKLNRSALLTQLALLSS